MSLAVRALERLPKNSPSLGMFPSAMRGSTGLGLRTVGPPSTSALSQSRKAVLPSGRPLHTKASPALQTRRPHTAQRGLLNKVYAAPLPAVHQHRGSHSSSQKALQSGDILSSVEAGVATITIANSGRLNSLSSPLISKLTSTLQSLGQQSDLRCVVIKGEVSSTKTPAFSSGANIYEMAAVNTYNDAKAFISRLHGACNAMRELPVVTIAQVHGLCFGGALELAAACDFRYASRLSSFSMPETKFGIPSVIEARLLPNIVGWQKAKELCYLAKIYEAEEVEKWGLLDGCYEDHQQLEEKVGEVAALIASYGNETMRAQKKLIRTWEETNLTFGTKAGIDAFADMFRDGGSEPKAYMKTFTERSRK